MTPDGTLSPCEMACQGIVDIVCGTDGVTYQSRCLLENDACRNMRGDTNVSVAYPGPCITTQSPWILYTRNSVKKNL